MSKMEDYRKYFGETPGWFEPNAIAIWDALLSFQEDQSLRGNFFEIGVWKGKSAGMAALHCRPGEKCIFVDMLPVDEARAGNEVAAPAANCQYVQAISADLRSSPLVRQHKGTMRWIHIDGGHSAADVEQDLAIADKLMHPEGMTVLDDFFTPAYPQIVQATFDYLNKNKRQFSLVLCGANKGYLCRPTAAKMYLQFIRDSLHSEMEARGCGDVTLWKTTTPDEVNAFGVTARDGDGLAYRGLDRDHRQIVI